MTATDPRMTLPQPCADCRALAARVAAVVPADDWDRVAAAHPHAIFDEQAAACLRCATCGCCWSVEWHWETKAAVAMRQLTQAEYRCLLRQARRGMPFWETATASALVNAGALACAALIAAVVVCSYNRAGASLWMGWSWLLASGVLAFVSGRELVNVARGR
jgi:hypothetical protein